MRSASAQHIPLKSHPNQFSIIIIVPGTRSNSYKLLLTNINPRLQVCAALLVQGNSSGLAKVNAAGVSRAI
ncbi:hypothetical protein AYM39_17180 [Methylomonas sp. DH-1]|nr:hypothetical protein AYM39_17180 [Methylomonas sp. DH-1]